jgi:hypothetical protein
VNEKAMSTAVSQIKSCSVEQAYDPTRLPTFACLIAGAILALFAVALSGPIDPKLLATMVAFP